MSTIDTAHAEAQHPPTTTNVAGAGDRIRRHRRQRQSYMAGCSSETTIDGSFRFSDISEDQYHSWSSSMGSIRQDECTPHGVVSGSWGEEDVVDLESGELEMTKANNDNNEEKFEKDCRICHLSLMGNGICDDSNNNGIGIELGCACKGDLGNAHKQCAETWFKIKGDITCEICGAIAINLAGQQELDLLSSDTAAALPAPVAFSERHDYCHGRRIINFLLACMIFAFVISWLFHFNVMS